MSSIWTITYNGVSRRLKDWGIIQPKLKLQALGIDTLSFAIAPNDITQAEEFQPDQLIFLSCDGSPRFVGRVKEVPSEGAPESDRHRYVIAGPWWDLETIIFQGDRKIRTDPSDDASALETVFTSYTALFQDIDKNQVSVGQQITNAIAYGETRGAYLAGGASEPTIKPPFEEAHDLSVAEVIQRCIRWAPDCVGYVDYSTNPPSFNVRKRTSLVAHTYDLNDGNKVRSYSVRKLTDLQPSGVKFYVERVLKSAATGQSWTYFSVLQAGFPDGRRGVVTTIPANSSDQDYGVLLASLAGEYWAAISPLQYGGAITITEDEYSGTLVPGTTVNLTGGKDWMATMRAVIQAVEIDLETGTSKATLGAPSHLGVQDIVSLSANSRSSSGGGTAGGGTPITRNSGEHSPAGTRDIPSYQQVQACVDGVEKTITIRVG